jgi:8-oxo-dGTP pyrophosphatase MutT (NUDIX family)
MAKRDIGKSRGTRGGLRASRGLPPSLQVGALCWRRTAKGALRVLLITSRDTGRWVIPKGWPMRNRSDAEAAAREAYEEAGVRGTVSERSLGLYFYPKVLERGGAIPCVVRVFPLAVEGLAARFPEAGQRRVKWFSAAKAARKVREPELARIVRGFVPEAPVALPEKDGTEGSVAADREAAFPGEDAGDEALGEAMAGEARRAGG